MNPNNRIVFDNIKRITTSPTRITEFYDVDQSQRRAQNKPKGLWYACGPEWLNWMSTDMPECLNKVNYIYELTLDPTTICFIRTADDLQKFDRKYGSKTTWGGETINWAKVARDYKGIEICPYQGADRYVYDWYYGWDIASGCIWDASAIMDSKEEIFTETAETYSYRPVYIDSDYETNPPTSSNRAAILMAGLAGFLLAKSK